MKIYVLFLGIFFLFQGPFAIATGSLEACLEFNLIAPGLSEDDLYARSETLPRPGQIGFLARKQNAFSVVYVLGANPLTTQITVFDITNASGPFVVDFLGFSRQKKLTLNQVKSLLQPHAPDPASPPNHTAINLTRSEFQQSDIFVRSIEHSTADSGAGGVYKIGRYLSSHLHSRCKLRYWSCASGKLGTSRYFS